MIEKLTKRTKKAVVHTLEKLIKKYGEVETRCVVNSFFNGVKERKKLEEAVRLQEQSLMEMKRKLNN